MKSLRPALATLALGLLCAQSPAQDDLGSIAPTGGGGGGGFFVPSGATDAAPAATSPGPSAPASSGVTAPSGGGAAPAAPPVTIEAGYGDLPVTVTPGAGNFARRPLRFRLNLSHGYDDNIFTTPDDPFDPKSLLPRPTPEPTPIIIPIPTPRPTPTPDGELIPNPFPIPTPTPTPTPPSFIEIPVPTPIPTPPLPEREERLGSMVTRTEIGASWASATGRSLLSADVSVGANHYWDRPNDEKTDYNGSLRVLYSRSLTPRARTNVSLNATYQTNPDFTRRNAPVREGGGAYLNATGRADLSYRITGRFNSVSSYQLSGNLYNEQRRQQDNIVEHTFGQQLKYLWTPRFTAVGEYRYRVTLREDETRNALSHFALIGIESKYNSRLDFSFRFGQQNVQYEVGESKQGAPRFELTARYEYGRGSSIGLTAEYGPDTADAVDREQTTFRLGISILHVFTPRLYANSGINWNRTDTKFPNDSLREGVTEDAVSFSLGLNYVYRRDITLYATYIFNKLLSTADFTSYTRNQFFVGFVYEF